jgi:hypothetical protein
MSMDVKIELIKLIPTILWITLITGIVIAFYKPIKRQLIPRMSGFKAFGVEATFVQLQLDAAAREAAARKEPEVAGSPSERSRVSSRAQRLSSIIKGAHILLINDNPEEMRYVTQILEGLQALVDVVRTTDETLANMHRRVYDVVISDMRRDDVQDEGQRFLNETVRQGIEQRTIFSVGQLDGDKGVPPHAFGITNRVDELLHLVFDALERVRG